MHRTFESFANPAEAAASSMNVGWDFADGSAIPQADDGRSVCGFVKIRQQIGVKRVSRAPDARSLGMIDLFQCPGRRIEPTPGVATGREPGPPIADILKAAGRQKAA